MALKGIQLMYYFVVTILATALGQGAMAQSGCSSTILRLAPCLGYIQGTSSNPTSSCCSQLASVVQSQPRCLCSLLNGGGSQLGIAINQTLALALPGACNVQTPPISRCNGGPTSSPTSSPVGSPGKTPSTPGGSPDSSPADSLSPGGSPQPTISGLPSGATSKTVPLTNGSTSDGNSIIRLPLHLTIFLLFTIAATTIKI